MRATYSRWSWVGLTSCCLAITALTGCKSGFKAPSTDWLSWGKPKPTSTSLASVPKKPSVGALPTPSATTAGAASPYGQTAYARNTTSPGGYGANAQSGGAASYQTGAYGTGAAGGYPAASSGLAGTQTATSPYRSPYQAAQGAASNYDTGATYGVADARSSGGYQGSSTPTSGNTQSWNSDPYRRAGDPYGTGQGSVSPYGGTQAVGPASQPYVTEPSISYPQTQSPYSSGNYGASNTSGYQQPASYQQAPQGGTATASRAYASDALEEAYPTSSTSTYESSSSGGYRPGSTSRETGALSTPPAAGSASSTGGYPTTGAPAATTANQPWSYGTSGQYPTTGQY